MLELIADECGRPLLHQAFFHFHLLKKRRVGLKLETFGVGLAAAGSGRCLSGWRFVTILSGKMSARQGGAPLADEVLTTLT